MGFNILTSVALLSSTVPSMFRAMPSAPNVTLQNAMACRVYRLLKLGKPEDDVSIYFNSRGPRPSLLFAPSSMASNGNTQISGAAGRFLPFPHQASDSRILGSDIGETQIEESSSKYRADRGLKVIV